MPGGYARILYELAEVKPIGDSAAKLDASIKQQDAENLLASGRFESGVSPKDSRGSGVRWTGLHFVAMNTGKGQQANRVV